VKSDEEKPAAEEAKTVKAEAVSKTPDKTADKTAEKTAEKAADTPAAESDSELVVADLDPSDDMEESVQFGKPAEAEGPHETAVTGATPVVPAQLIPALKILVVLAVVGVLGWSALMIIKRVGAAKVNSYQSCVQAGNPVQESYPPVCIDKRTGKHYDAFGAQSKSDVD